MFHLPKPILLLPRSLKTKFLPGLGSFILLYLFLSLHSHSTAFGADSGDVKAMARAEKRRFADENRAAQRKAEEEKKQAEEDRKQRDEQEKIIKKYSKFSTGQLGVNVASLTQQIRGGYANPGSGLLGLIPKAALERKVKERDEIAMEIVRREELADPQPISSSTDNRPQSSGTGFLITEDGYLITNHHVVKRGRSLKIRTAQGDFPAKLIASDAANDLALLKVEGHFSPLPIISSRSVRLGETVSTVGFPNPDLQGFSPKLTKGEISSLAGINDDPKHFQISLPLQPGNSGGALVNTTGNVVGIIVASLSQEAQPSHRKRG